MGVSGQPMDHPRLWTPTFANAAVNNSGGVEIESLKNECTLSCGRRRNLASLYREWKNRRVPSLLYETDCMSINHDQRTRESTHSWTPDVT